MLAHVPVMYVGELEDGHNVPMSLPTLPMRARKDASVLKPLPTSPFQLLRLLQTYVM